MDFRKRGRDVSAWLPVCGTTCTNLLTSRHLNLISNGKGWTCIISLRWHPSFLWIWKNSVHAFYKVPVFFLLWPLLKQVTSHSHWLRHTSSTVDVEGTVLLPRFVLVVLWLEPILSDSFNLPILMRLRTKYMTIKTAEITRPNTRHIAGFPIQSRKG